MSCFACDLLYSSLSQPPKPTRPERPRCLSSCSPSDASARAGLMHFPLASGGSIPGYASIRCGPLSPTPSLTLTAHGVSFICVTSGYEYRRDKRASHPHLDCCPFTVTLRAAACLSLGTPGPVQSDVTTQISQWCAVSHRANDMGPRPVDPLCLCPVPRLSGACRPK